MMYKIDVCLEVSQKAPFNVRTLGHERADVEIRKPYRETIAAISIV